MSQSHTKTLVALTLALVMLAIALVPCFASAPAEPITQWTYVATLPAPRFSSGVIARDEWLYLIGGRDAQNRATADVWRTRIASDGSLSPWTPAPSLPVPLALHAVAEAGGWIYVIGGHDDRNYHAEVWRAQIMDDGSLTPWQRDRDYPMPITLHSATAQNGYLYVVGGTTVLGSETPLTRQVYFAAIGPDGSLAPWRQAAELPRSLHRMATTSNANHLYVSGGYDGTSVGSEVWVADFKSDGSLGSWRIFNAVTPREYHSAVVHDGRLVLIGGRDSTTSPGLSTVSAAAINYDGSLGTWTEQPSLPKPIYRMGAASVRIHGSDTIFVLGGFTGSAQGGQALADVYRSKVPPTPTPTSTPTKTLTPTVTPSPTATATPLPQLQAFLMQRPLEGNLLQYEILVENISSRVAYGVAVTNQVPGNTSVSQVLDNGRWYPAVPSFVRWELGSIAPGTSRRVRYIVQIISAQLTTSDSEDPVISIEFKRDALDEASASAISAIRAGNLPRIDGDLSEWSGLTSTPLNSLPGNYSKVEGSLPSLEDLSAGLWAAWAPGALYFAADITDDILIGNDSVNIWEDDIIELAIYVARAGQNHQFSLCVDGRQSDLGIPFSSLIVGRRTRPGGWQVEVEIPVSVLGSGTLMGGQQYPFNFALWDDDIGGGGRGQTHLYWQSDSTYTYKPDWGTLLLSNTVYDFPAITPTPTPSPSRTITPSVTPSRTVTPSATPTPSHTITPSATPTPSRTPSATPSPALTATSAPTPTPSRTRTVTPTPTGSWRPSVPIYNAGAEVTWSDGQYTYLLRTNALYWFGWVPRDFVWIPIILR